MPKTILITGSSQGIGAAIAKHFGSIGYNVIVTYKNAKKEAEDVIKSIQAEGKENVAFQLDVTSEESVKEVFAKVAKRFGKLDVLVNNAAVDWLNPIETSTFDEWKEIVHTKIDGNFLCTKYALPLLKKAKNANIIVIMSNLGNRVDPEDPAYSVGTAGTIAFAKCMALALAKYGIRTNGVAPGPTKTNSKYWQTLKDSEATWKKLAEENPMGRVTDVTNVAKVVQMLVEDPTNYINGSFVYVNGGGHLK